jgi:hypothetical protein
MIVSLFRVWLEPKRFGYDLFNLRVNSEQRIGDNVITLDDDAIEKCDGVLDFISSDATHGHICYLLSVVNHFF